METRQRDPEALLTFMRGFMEALLFGEINDPEVASILHEKMNAPEMTEALATFIKEHPERARAWAEGTGLCSES